MAGSVGISFTGAPPMARTRRSTPVALEWRVSPRRHRGQLGHAGHGCGAKKVASAGSATRPYPARQAPSIVALAAFKVAWVSRAILPFAIKFRSLAFRVVVE